MKQAVGVILIIAAIGLGIWAYGKMKPYVAEPPPPPTPAAPAAGAKPTPYGL